MSGNISFFRIKQEILYCALLIFRSIFLIDTKTFGVRVKTLYQKAVNFQGVYRDPYVYAVCARSIHPAHGGYKK